MSEEIEESDDLNSRSGDIDQDTAAAGPSRLRKRGSGADAEEQGERPVKDDLGPYRDRASGVACKSTHRDLLTAAFPPYTNARVPTRSQCSREADRYRSTYMNFEYRVNSRSQNSKVRSAESAVTSTS